MDKRKGNTDLTEGKVWKVIVRFAVPLLVGNLLQQFYNITDSIIVGQFLGKEALAAVSASFFIYYFIISLVIGVGSGTTVVISQLFGAKQYQKVQLAFSSFYSPNSNRLEPSTGNRSESRLLTTDTLY